MLLSISVRRMVCCMAVVLLASSIGYSQINDTTVAAAETIIGLRFTEQERDSFKSDLDEQLKAYQTIRNHKLDNEVPPAITFNPIPVDYDRPSGQNRLQLRESQYKGLPANRSDLAFYSVRDLAHLIRTRQMTSLELTRFFIDRLRRYDQQLHCVITITEERALREARQADAEITAGQYRGPLHGIPYGAKDLLAVKGYKTTWGAEPYKNQVIDEDAAVIKKLHDAGAVLVAKLTLGALAWGDVWYGGMTRNPWNLQQGSSGSSAGSAAATAAGLVPFAIGSETWGSIV
ncbi:MAG: amidase, partial [Caldithrix sp.]|nr:amidase [Caldithrix sp.]